MVETTDSAKLRAIRSTAGSSSLKNDRGSSPDAVVDEALAVGDVYFRQRCMRKVHELRSRGITILFVSHATGDIKALGDRAIWLDHGKVRAIGKADLIVMSSHRVGVRTYFLGSNAGHVVRYAACSVMVVRR